MITLAQLARRLDLDQRTLKARLSKLPQQTAGTIKGKPIYNEAELPAIRANIVTNWKPTQSLKEQANG